MRYELRYFALGNHWEVVDTRENRSVNSFRSRLAAQRLANSLNGEIQLTTKEARSTK